MKINDNGKIRVNRYYVQSLCMLFFPGEKFSVKEEEIREGEPILDYSVTRDGDIISAKVTLTLGNKSETHIAELEVKNTVTEEKTAKLALGTAMYYAGEKLVGTTLTYKSWWSTVISSLSKSISSTVRPANSLILTPVLNRKNMAS